MICGRQGFKYHGCSRNSGPAPAVYRFLTAALSHGSLLHYAFNMMALVPTGAWRVQLSSLPARQPAHPPIRRGFPLAQPHPCISRRRLPATSPALQAPGRVQPAPPFDYSDGSHALCPAGTALERALGSLQFLWIMLLLCVLGDSLYVSIALLSSFLPVSR